jgi:secretion/DNA translocation related TadE-like protein
MRRRIRDDGGFGTVLVLALTAALGLVIAALLAVAVAGRARARAETAADLAALGGAARASTDAASACAVAERIAAKNGARLVECRARPERVDVAAEVAINWPLLPRAVRARAAAGRR